MRVLLFGGALCLLAASALAQNPASGPAAIPLRVEAGFPIRLIVTQNIRFKRNEPVRGQVTNPVYAFDREVIPAGAAVTGRIVGFRRPSRWIRASALMSGNFTPLREPQIAFDTLLLKDGRSLSMATDVAPGTDRVVRFTDPKSPPKGRVAAAKDIARNQIDQRKRAIIDAVKAPGKLDRIKTALWSLSPYQPQSLPPGTRFTATLRSPLDFGKATPPPSELDQVGAQAPSDGVVDAFLATALDSHTAQHGMAVEAILARPVFSADHRLVLPEGSRLHGSVVQARPARHWHRSGKLAFMFTGIEAPALMAPASPQVRQVEGRLESIEVDGKSGNVRMDEEAGATVADSKKRFIAPAIEVLLAARSTEGKDVEPDNDADDAGGAMRSAQAGGPGNNFGPRILAGGIGFGLIGAALGRLSQPVASALGFYGAGRSVYSNVIGKGTEVTFPKNTPLVIRFSPPAVPQ